MQISRHLFQPGHGVGVGGVDTFVGVVVVDGIGHQPYRSVDVVHDRQVGRHQQGKLRQAEIIRVVVW